MGIDSIHLNTSHRVSLPSELSWITEINMHIVFSLKSSMSSSTLLLFSPYELYILISILKKVYAFIALVFIKLYIAYNNSLVKRVFPNQTCFAKSDIYHVACNCQLIQRLPESSSIDSFSSSSTMSSSLSLCDIVVVEVSTMDDDEVDEWRLCPLLRDDVTWWWHLHSCGEEPPCGELGC